MPMFSSFISSFLANLPQLGAYLTILVAVISIILNYRAQSVNNRNVKDQVVILGKQTSLQELEAILNERRTDNQSLELKVEKQGIIIEKQGKLIEQMRLDIQQLTLSNQQLVEENRKLLEFIQDNEDILVKNYALLQAMDHNDTEDRKRSNAMEAGPGLPEIVRTTRNRQTKTRGIFAVPPSPSPSPLLRSPHDDPPDDDDHDPATP